MKLQKFGGEWTEDKLACIRKYLEAYRMIFSRNPKAKFYSTYYIDAFAGTGYRTTEKSGKTNPTLQVDDDDTVNYIKGSARIALEIESPFDNYIFIEKKKDFVKELEKLCQEYPNNHIDIINGDANVEIPRLCQQINWRNSRAVLFLDPFGMSVKWDTLMAVAKTQAIDMWLLFPVGALNRMMTQRGLPPDSWGEKITDILGTDQWKEMYQPNPQMSFMDDMQADCKNSSFENLGELINSRLKSIFPGVAPRPLQLCNSKNSPIFLLCFATGNPKTVSTAIGIADNILKNQAR